MRFLLIAALLLVTSGARAAEPDQALIDAARKEGSVVWYSTLIINQIVRPMVAAFEAKYPGIKVEYSRAASSDVALKIVNEARARRVQSDLFDGSNTVFLLRDPRLVASYTPKAAEVWPAELKSKDGTWTALNVFYWTAAYNTNLVKPEEVPKTYQDLLDPKWKGKIAWTYDLTPGGPPGFVHNILSTMGQEKGMAYLRTFAEQQPVTIPGAQRVVLDHVISGEYPLCVMILNYHAEISMKAGAPVRWLKMEPVLQTMGSGQHHRQRSAPERGAADGRVHAVGGRPKDPGGERLYPRSSRGSRAGGRVETGCRRFQGQPHHAGHGARSVAGMDRDV